VVAGYGYVKAVLLRDLLERRRLEVEERERKRKSREHRWRLIARGEMEPFVMDDVMAMWSDLSEGYVPRRSDRAERRGRAEAAEDEGLDRLLQAVSAQKVAA
jgi:hypothetical protein